MFPLSSTSSGMTALRLSHERLPFVVLLQADKAAQAQGNALPLGFHPAQRVLCVGEGNFSFARALARLFDGDGSCLVATAYDSEEQAQLKYEVSCDRHTACRHSTCLVVARLSCTLWGAPHGFDTCQLKYEVNRELCLHMHPQGCGSLTQFDWRCRAVRACGWEKQEMHKSQAGLLH